MSTKILSYLIYLLVKFLKLTYRYKFTGEENRLKAIAESRSHSYVYSMWHQNAVPGMISQWGRPHHILLSPSKDGDLVEETANKMNYNAIRGSSTRGGVEALRKLIDKLKNGENAAVTPDGPLGPAKKLKKGVLDMAKESGCAILPLSMKASKFYSFNSWDKLRLPYPFARIVVRYGEPIFIPEEIDILEFTNYRDKVVEEMKRTEEMVDVDLLNWSTLPKTNPTLATQN